MTTLMAAPTRRRAVAASRANLARRLARVFAGLRAFPVYWMVNTSFLPRNEIRSPTRPGCRSAATLDNYRTVLSTASQPSSTRSGSA